jgi:hypothetical protein
MGYQMQIEQRQTFCNLVQVSPGWSHLSIIRLGLFEHLLEQVLALGRGTGVQNGGHLLLTTRSNHANKVTLAGSGLTWRASAISRSM